MAQPAQELVVEEWGHTLSMLNRQRLLPNFHPDIHDEVLGFSFMHQLLNLIESEET